MAEPQSHLPDAPFAIVDPERIPTPRYFDAEFYRHECEDLWPHAWQMACRLEQVAERCCDARGPFTFRFTCE